MEIFCHGYIASHSKQNHQAPENEHQAAQNHPSNRAPEPSTRATRRKSNRPRNNPQTVKDTEKENRPRNHPGRKISNTLILTFLICNPNIHPLLKEDEDESPAVLKLYQ